MSEMSQILDTEDKLLSTDDLLEKRLHELCEEIGKTPFDDPRRKDLIAEAKTIAEIIKSRGILDQARAMGKMKAQLEHEKIEVESDRNIVEGKKAKILLLQIFLYFFGGAGAHVFSYVADEFYQKNQGMQKFAEDCNKMIIKIFKL